jgi:hypothetical protein
MLIDCDSCAMRDIACSDCVVTMLLDRSRPDLDQDECQAVDILANAGLISPLRLVPLMDVSAGKPTQKRSIA